MPAAQVGQLSIYAVLCDHAVIKSKCPLLSIGRVKRSLNNDLDLIPPLALQAGGHWLDLGHLR
jgi:hypothetical protein